MRDREFTIVEHLEELRKRLIICIIAIVVAMAVSWSFTKTVLGLLIKPVGKVVFLSPQEPLLVYFKVSLAIGIIIASPIIMYQVWKFIAVALTVREKQYVYYFVPASIILFLSGVLFCYYLILPLIVTFLLTFATDSLTPMISINNYVSFAGMFLLIFGAIFEFPLVVVMLTKLHIITPQYLQKKRRYNIVIIFIIATILTPPDAFTQLVMAIPLLVLYEVSILLSKIVYKQ